MTSISVIALGAETSPILDSLLDLEGVKINVICSNLLDFELPPLVENAAPIWHRHELRNALKQIGPDKFDISKSLQDLLKENDRLQLSDEFLGVTSHISQIEQNSQNIFIAYDLLLKQTDRYNVSLIPLVETNPNLLVFKNKKYAPLRYYCLEKNLLQESPPPKENNQKRKYNDKELVIEGIDELQEIKLSEIALETLTESDLIVILPTDILSFAILVKADNLEGQLKNLHNPLVLVWPFSSDNEPTDIEVEITKALEVGTSLEELGEDISFLTDYVLIKKSEKDKLELLREAGAHVLVSEFWDDEEKLHENFLKTLFGVSDLGPVLEENDLDKSKEVDQKDEDEEIEEEARSKELEENGEDSRGKKISQLMESPEEAGIKEETDDLPESEPIEDEEDITEIIEEIKEKENHIDSDQKEIEGKTKEEKDELVSEADKLVSEIDFEVLEDEDWIDSVKRAIELSLEKDNDQALNWLISQSKGDSDREVRIANLGVSSWLQSRSLSDRKRGAEILSIISEDHRETYIQILQRHVVQAVKNREEDKRRMVIPLFHLLNDVDVNFSEDLIREITIELSTLSDEEEMSVVELAKLTILQLVIHSRRLTRVTIQELLDILVSKPNIGPEIWNILISFDAGSVALELVTNYSINKVEEIIRRSNLLRFTGSYYSTITKVIQSWKEGDKAAISLATGTIIPEETLRKFERLELARKLSKLKMVQLTTLADSLGKDVETVERLITELIVNDELKAEMKLIDDKMYLVSTVEQTETSE